MTRIGPMVGTLIRARGETVLSVADVLGIHRNGLADKIAGRRQFTELEIVTLAEHFGLEPGQLFEDPLELLGVSQERRTSSRCTALYAGQNPFLTSFSALDVAAA